jgi:hypothetical protein
MGWAIFWAIFSQTHLVTTTLSGFCSCHETSVKKIKIYRLKKDAFYQSRKNAAWPFST